MQYVKSVSDIPDKQQPVLKVAVNVPLSREFDYLPPADGPVPAPGARVAVQFGPRRQTGLVMSQVAETELAPGKLKRCVAGLDDSPFCPSRTCS